MPVPKSVWIGLVVAVVVATVVLIALYATDRLPGLEARRPRALDEIRPPAGASAPHTPVPDPIDAALTIPAAVDPFSNLEAALVGDGGGVWHGRNTAELRGATASVGDEPEEGVGSNFAGLGTIADPR